MTKSSAPAASVETQPPITPPYQLRLFVSGAAPCSTRAIATIHDLGEQHLHGRHQLEVIDAEHQAKRLRPDQIVVLPTLIKTSPPPVRRLVGDLSDEDRVLVGLGLTPQAAPQG